MSRTPRASQADITRAVKGAEAAGMSVARVIIDGSRIVIETESVSNASNPLDQWLETSARKSQGHPQGKTPPSVR
jgi:hypothetical protein